MRFQTRSAPDWTRTSASFQTADFKSATSTISVTRAWLSGQGSNLRCVSQSHMCYHYTTRQYFKYLWRESNSQLKLILSQLCLPIAPHRHGCPEVNRTPALWFRATRSTAKLQDNFEYSQRDSNS